MPDPKPLAISELVTESVNPRTADLDQIPPLDLVLRINAEDQLVAEAVRACAPEIAEALEAMVAALRAGGAVHLVGAGTSGRLAVLDASEIPPTFGAPAEWFRGHIAGGDRALRDAVEGAEDSLEAGAKLVQELGLGPNDLLLALSASGRTPFCIGALREASRRETPAVAVVCNPATEMHTEARITIAPVTGPEAVTGSTRMKAGSAQKLVLNTLSTGAMVRMGATYGNLMVGLTPTNAKLIGRAERLIQRVAACPPERAAEALRACENDARAAIVSVRLDLPASAAQARLAQAGGSLRRALGEAN